jgi:uncharacterized protein YkwD
MVAAILISIGLVAVLLSPAFSGKPTASSGQPRLPGIPDSTLASGAAQPAPQVPSDQITPDPTATAEPSDNPASQAADNGNAAVENTVVALVNNERRKARCDPVQVDPGLQTAARQHSADMAAGDFINHKGSDGSSPNDRMRAAGFNDPLSENVAKGFNSARNVMKAWVKNHNDRDNIVDCDASAIGVGVAVSSDGTPYWTQDFGR